MLNRKGEIAYLRLLEVGLDHGADVLSMGEIERRVHLIQNVDGRRLEL